MPRPGVCSGCSPWLRLRALLRVERIKHLLVQVRLCQEGPDADRPPATRQPWDYMRKQVARVPLVRSGFDDAGAVGQELLRTNDALGCSNLTRPWLSTKLSRRSQTLSSMRASGAQAYWPLPMASLRGASSGGAETGDQVNLKASLSCSWLGCPVREMQPECARSKSIGFMAWSLCKKGPAARELNKRPQRGSHLENRPHPIMKKALPAHSPCHSQLMFNGLRG